MPTRQQQASPMTKILISVASTLVGTGIVVLVAWAFGLVKWQGGVDSQLNEHSSMKTTMEAMDDKVDTTLQVVADHGTEFTHLRAEIQTLRGELLATRTELLEAVRDRSGDRFTGTDWEREKEIISLRFQAMENTLDRILKKMEEG